MRITVVHAALAGVLAANLGGGCEFGGMRQAYTKDPLLVNKKPIEGKIENARPLLMAQVEPVVPQLSPQAVASMPMPHEARFPAGFPLLAQADPPPGPRDHSPDSGQGLVPGLPVSRRSTGSVPGTLAVQRKVSGSYGHAPDYSWLQGVLDRRYPGHQDLHYADPPGDDPWGGTVCLIEDPRLARFQDGDVILVEGELLPNQEVRARDPWHDFPHYRIQEVALVQGAN